MDLEGIDLVTKVVVQEKLEGRPINSRLEFVQQDNVVSLPEEWVYTCSVSDEVKTVEVEVSKETSDKQVQGLQVSEEVGLQTTNDKQHTEEGLSGDIQAMQQSILSADAEKGNKAPAARKRTKKWGLCCL